MKYDEFIGFTVNIMFGGYYLTGAPVVAIISCTDLVVHVNAPLLWIFLVRWKISAFHAFHLPVTRGFDLEIYIFRLYLEVGHA